ncbi:DUF4238 domain-containing protein [Streptomyces albidoflavus]
MSKPDGRKTKRHHHTVPRFYLRRFAAPDSRLLRVPIDGSAARLVGVGDAAVHKDFYSFRGPDGSLDDVVENQISVVEDAAAPVLRKVVDERRWPLFGDDREIMALWVALPLTILLCRSGTPRYRIGLARAWRLSPPSVCPSIGASLC